MFRRRHSDDQELKASKLEACQDFVAAWEEIHPCWIGDAWDIFLEEPDLLPSRIAKERDDEMLRHHRQYVENLRAEAARRRIETKRKDDDLGYKLIEL